MTAHIKGRFLKTKHPGKGSVKTACVNQKGSAAISAALLCILCVLCLLAAISFTGCAGTPQKNADLTIYLMRHGRTESNEENRLVGAGGNAPLTEAGKEVIAETAETLKNVRFDAVYTSELGRTQETADMVLEANNYGCENRQVLADLNDADLGQMEGMLYEDVLETFGSDWFGDLHDPDFVSPSGAENAWSQNQRLTRAMEQIVRENDDGTGRNVLVVGHSIFGAWLAETTGNSECAQLENGRVTILTYHDGMWKIEAVNEGK